MTAIAEGIIANDIPCRRCGYNLRGLAESGLCPECGTAVGLSTRGDLLRYADPQWLQKLQVGLWLMVAGAICTAVLRLGGGLLYMYLPREFPVFIYFGFGLISVAGVWLVTSPDPAGLAEAQYVTARKLIRILLIAGLAHRIVTLGANAQTLQPDLKWMLMVLAYVVSVAGIVGEFAKFHYLAQLAARIPRPQLVWWARVLKWLYPLAHAPSLILSLLLTVVPRSPRMPLASIAWIFGIVAIIQIPVWVIGAFFYGRFARSVSAQRRFEVGFAVESRVQS